MQQLRIYLTISSFILFMSCGSGGGPEVNITSPSSGQVFTAGATIVVNGVVTDDIEIDKVFISLENIYDEFELAIQGVSPYLQVDLSGIRLDIPIDTPAGEYEIIVRGIDKEGLSGEDSVTIKVE